MFLLALIRTQMDKFHMLSYYLIKFFLLISALHEIVSSCYQKSIPVFFAHITSNFT